MDLSDLTMAKNACFTLLQANFISDIFWYNYKNVWLKELDGTEKRMDRRESWNSYVDVYIS